MADVTITGLTVDQPAKAAQAKTARPKTEGEQLIDRALVQLGRGHNVAALQTLCTAIELIGNEHGIDARARIA